MNFEHLTARQVNTKLRALRTKREKLTDKFIADGRGHERFSDYVHKQDKLSQDTVLVSHTISELRAECVARYGPNCPSELPIKRGFFGPRKNGTPSA